MFKRFRLKGLSGTNVEFGLKAIAHNLMKLSNKVAFSDLFAKISAFLCAFWYVLTKSQNPHGKIFKYVNNPEFCS
jgi:hypothetical protein